MSVVVVIGAGGHAKVVVSTLRAVGHTVSAVCDDDATQWGTEILGVPVSGTVERARLEGPDFGVIAIGDNATRQDFAQRLDVRWLTLVHPTAHIAADATLGVGTVVCAGAIILPGSVIGDHVIVNTGATVDHDCVVESFSHLAPGVHLAGQVHVSEGVLLGIGCVVTPGRRIGEWTTVGAGGVVVRDLPGGVVAYGAPATPQRLNESRRRPHGTPLC